MTAQNEEKIRESELLPCPFCGAGTIEFVSNGMIWTGVRFSEPTSVSVSHWCEKVEGQPSRRIERIGRDRESAIAAWNMRAAIAQERIESQKREAELQKNAARYRWLKEHGYANEKNSSNAVIGDNKKARIAFRYWCSPTDCDALIDEAMRAHPDNAKE